MFLHPGLSAFQGLAPRVYIVDVDAEFFAPAACWPGKAANITSGTCLNVLALSLCLWSWLMLANILLITIGTDHHCDGGLGWRYALYQRPNLNILTAALRMSARL